MTWSHFAGKDLESRVAEYAKKEAAAAARASKDGESGSQNAKNDDNEEKRANAEEEAFEGDDEDGYGHDDDDYTQVSGSSLPGLGHLYNGCAGVRVMISTCYIAAATLMSLLAIWHVMAAISFGWYRCLLLRVDNANVQ